MIKRLISKLRRSKTRTFGAAPIVVSRDQHGLSRSQMSHNVLKVLYRLQKAGYDAYLVGGCLRDLLLDRTPKDFDVSTSASPEEVRALFSNCRLIGRRFRLAHVYFGRDIIEVATFRGMHTEKSGSTHTNEGRILRDNIYGTLEEDAWRRDFTVNALYYNIADDKIIDYTGGLADLQAKKLSIIGQPEERYREDPVRMLRAIRFSSMLNMQIASETETPIPGLVSLLQHVPNARLFDEIIKLFHCGAATEVLRQLKQYHFFENFFPQTSAIIEKNHYPAADLIDRVCANTDDRIAQGKFVTPTFLFVCLLWYPMCAEKRRLEKKGVKPYPALFEAADYVIRKQGVITSISHRVAQAIKEIWLMQKRLEDRPRSKVNRVVVESRFRAAYDFLLLRDEVGEPVGDAGDWWTHFYEADEHARDRMVEALPERRSRHKRSRGSRGKHKKRSDND